MSSKVCSRARQRIASGPGQGYPRPGQNRRFTGCGAPSGPSDGHRLNAGLGARALHASSLRAMGLVELDAARSDWGRWGPLRGVPGQPGQRHNLLRGTFASRSMLRRVHEAPPEGACGPPVRVRSKVRYNLMLENHQRSASNQGARGDSRERANPKGAG